MAERTSHADFEAAGVRELVRYQEDNGGRLPYLRHPLCVIISEGKRARKSEERLIRTVNDVIEKKCWLDAKCPVHPCTRYGAKLCKECAPEILQNLIAELKSNTEEGK